jgi:HK97 family phage prohead protease
VVACVNHDQSQILGRTRNKTLQLTDDNDGLRFTVRLNPDVQAHRDIYNLVKDGTLSECSFAFGAMDDDWSDAKDERGNRYQLRTVKKARLFDVSIVASPAYGGGATDAQARSLAYQFAGPVDPWITERSALQVLDDKHEDALLRIRLEHVGRQIEREK